LSERRLRLTHQERRRSARRGQCLGSAAARTRLHDHDARYHSPVASRADRPGNGRWRHGGRVGRAWSRSDVWWCEWRRTTRRGDIPGSAARWRMSGHCVGRSTIAWILKAPTDNRRLGDNSPFHQLSVATFKTLPCSLLRARGV